MVFEEEPVKLTMGEVVTPYHILKLDMATERQRLEQVGVKVSGEGLHSKTGKEVYYFYFHLCVVC